MNRIAELATKWYSLPDSSTHSAAAWLMGEWEIPEPTLPNAEQMVDDRNWFVNSQGVTFVRITPPKVELKPIADPLEIRRPYMSKTEEGDSKEKIEPSERFYRGKALYLFGEFEQSISELDALLDVEDDLDESWKETLNEAERLRLFSFAKLKREKEAKGAMSLYHSSNENSYNLGVLIRFLLHTERPSNSDPSYSDYVECLVPLWLGNKEEAVQRLEKSLSHLDSADRGKLYNLARCFALFAADESASVEEKQSWTAKSLSLLKRWSPDDEMSRAQMRGDPDFTILHEDARFLVLACERSIPGRTYWLASREVTRGEYAAFLDDADYQEEKPQDRNETKHPAGQEAACPTLEYPALNVSWYDAVMYCNWLSRRERRMPAYRSVGKQKMKDDYDRELEVDKWEQVKGANGYRLPVELEWEYACRAGSEPEWSTGSDDSLLAAYCQMSPSKSASPSGKKLPNAWGIHDMHGNLVEWCGDA